MGLILDQFRAEDVERVWPLLEPHFIAACEAVTTDLTPADIKEKALAGKSDLWAFYRSELPVPVLAAFSSFVRKVGTEKILVCEAVGGERMNMEMWLLPVLDEVERLARQNGATRIEFEGRPGWARVLPGFRVARVVMEKVL